MSVTDPSEILPNLYQGTEPQGSVDPRVDTLVLCWREGQGAWGRFDGSRLRILRAPMDDDQRTLRPLDATVAVGTAADVAMAVKTGGVVLVTCRLGLNRSGLVSALAARLILRCSGAEALALVRARRPGALSNPGFVAYLASLPAP